MTTTLVTGGTGMLGSAIVRRLLAGGDRVVLLARAKSTWFLRGRGLDPDAVRWSVGDTADPELIGATLDTHRVDRAVHVAAAVSSVANTDPFGATMANCVATVGLLEACRVRDIRRVVLCSSVSVYAPQRAYRPDEVPLTERALLGFAPGAPLYGAGKAYLEAAGRWYATAYGMEVAGLRPAFIASAGKPSRPPLGTVTGELVDGPACGRPVSVDGPAGRVPYVYVEDVVDQFHTLLTAPADKLRAGPFFNSGSTAHTVGEIVETVRRLVPDARIHVGDSDSADLTFGMPSEFSDQLFVETFGVRRRHDLEAGIRAQIEEARRWPDLFA